MPASITMMGSFASSPQIRGVSPRSFRSPGARVAHAEKQGRQVDGAQLGHGALKASQGDLRTQRSARSSRLRASLSALSSEASLGSSSIDVLKREGLSEMRPRPNEKLRVHYESS